MQLNKVSSNSVYILGSFSFDKQKCHKIMKIALSILMGIGMIASYSVGAPWIITFGFFALIFLPLFRLGNPKLS